MEPSQLLNKVLGRNQDTFGVEFWRQPERSGWLMKQGEYAQRYVARANDHGRLGCFEAASPSAGLQASS